VLVATESGPGDELVAYGVGFGDVTPAILPGVIAGQSNTVVKPVTISVGEIEAFIAYAGLAPGFVGLYELFFIVPLGLGGVDYVPPEGGYSVSLTQNGNPTPQVLNLTLHSAPLPASQIAALTLSAASVADGGTVQGTVTLTAPALGDGANILLFSNSSAASVPAAVMVPAGAASANFTITTTPLASSQTASIMAGYAGSMGKATLAISTPIPKFSYVSLDRFKVLEMSCASASGTMDINLGAGGSQNYAAIGTLSLSCPTQPDLGASLVFKSALQTGTTIALSGIDVQNSEIFEGGSASFPTSGSMTINLAPDPGSSFSGTMSGMFTVSSPTVSISGMISGTYVSSP
jgi:hypothetical protein